MDPILYRALDIQAAQARLHSRWQDKPLPDRDPPPHRRPAKRHWWQRLSGGT